VPDVEDILRRSGGHGKMVEIGATTLPRAFVTRMALNVRSASCTPAEGEHPFRPFAFPRQADLFASILRRNNGTVKEGDGPVELAVEIQLRQQRPPDALPYALLASALESSPYGRWRAILTGPISLAAASDKRVKDALDGPTAHSPQLLPAMAFQGPAVV
jgi:hypothetical protein